jgi:hypothetical protein
MALDGADFGMVEDRLVTIDALRRMHFVHGTPILTATPVLPRPMPPLIHPPVCYHDDEDILHVWNGALLVVLRKAPRLPTPCVNGWRLEHVHDLNVHSLRARVNRYTQLGTYMIMMPVSWRVPLAVGLFSNARGSTWISPACVTTLLRSTPCCM